MHGGSPCSRFMPQPRRDLSLTGSRPMDLHWSLKGADRAVLHGQAQSGTHRKPSASAPHVAPRAPVAAGPLSPCDASGLGGQGLREGIPEPHGRPHGDQHPGCADGKAGGGARPKPRVSGPQTVSFLLTSCWYLWTRPSRDSSQARCSSPGRLGAPPPAGSVLLPRLQSKTLLSWVKSRKQVPVCDRVPCPRDAGRPHRMPGAELLAGVKAARGGESGGPAVVCSHKN